MQTLLDKTLSATASCKKKEKSCSSFSFQTILIAINLIFIALGLIIVGIAAYGRTETVFMTLPIFGGLIGCGVILVSMALLGLCGVIKHGQTVLFVYVISISLLLITLLVFAVAAVIIPKNQQYKLVKKAWSHIDYEERKKIENVFECCGLDKDDDERFRCDVTLGYCYKVIKEHLNQALTICGAVGLSMSFTLLSAVYCTILYRNQKESRFAVAVY